MSWTPSDDYGDEPVGTFNPHDCRASQCREPHGGEEVDQDAISATERKLKLCPMDAGKPFFDEVSVHGYLTKWAVECETCGCSLQGDDYEEAAEKWNKRTSLPVERKVVRSVSKEHWTGY